MFKFILKLKYFNKNNINAIPSNITKQWTLSNIPGAFAVGLANVFCHAGTFVCSQRTHVSFGHGNSCYGGIADGIFFTNGPGSHGSVWEWGLEGIEQVYHNVDELQQYRISVTSTWLRRNHNFINCFWVFDSNIFLEGRISSRLLLHINKECWYLAIKTNSLSKGNQELPPKRSIDLLRHT